MHPGDAKSDMFFVWECLGTLPRSPSAHRGHFRMASMVECVLDRVFSGPPSERDYIYIYILASNVHAHRCYRCYPKCPSFSTDHLKHGQTAYQNTSHVRPGFPGIQLTWPSTVARTSGCSASDVPWDGLGSLPCRPNKLNYKTIL